MEAFGTILEGLESPDTQARREAVYGLGFFSGEERRARAVAQAIINNPTAAWKGEAGISLLRLDLADVPDKLRLLSDASAGGVHPIVLGGDRVSTGGAHPMVRVAYRATRRHRRSYAEATLL